MSDPFTIRKVGPRPPGPSPPMQTPSRRHGAVGARLRGRRLELVAAALLVPLLGLGELANASEKKEVLTGDDEVFVETERREIALAPAGTLRVVNHLGDVRARRAATDQLSVISIVQRFRPDQDDARVPITEENGSVEVTALFPSAISEANDQGLAGRIDLTLLVPSGAEMTVETKQGLIEIKGVRRKLEARSTSGPIRVSTSQSVRAHSESGMVGVTLRSPGAEEPARLSTRSGRIRVDFPEDPLPALLARTGGEILVHSLPQNPKPAEDDPTISVLQIGKKPSVIHVESQTGSIKLHAMKSSRLR
ncbi:MAG: hypothetical protein VCC04_14985 [Myxococcota bacterium]